MIVGTVLQQPNEYLDYDIDYTAFFIANAADQIASGAGAGQPGYPTAVSNPVGLTLNPQISNDSKSVKLWVGNVQANIEYKITITITSVNGRVKEDELILIGQDF
jgi:hypothetical protein